MRLWRNANHELAGVRAIRDRFRWCLPGVLHIIEHASDEGSDALKSVHLTVSQPGKRWELCDRSDERFIGTGPPDSIGVVVSVHGFLPSVSSRQLVPASPDTAWPCHGRLGCLLAGHLATACGKPCGRFLVVWVHRSSGRTFARSAKRTPLELLCIRTRSVSILAMAHSITVDTTTALWWESDV